MIIKMATLKHKEVKASFGFKVIKCRALVKEEADADAAADKQDRPWGQPTDGFRHWIESGIICRCCQEVKVCRSALSFFIVLIVKLQLLAIIVTAGRCVILPRIICSMKSYINKQFLY